MGRIKQYHTHTHIVDGYKILSVPIPMDIKLYPYPYPLGIQRVYQILHNLLTILLPSIVYWGLEHRISISLIWEDMWITTNASWDAQLLLPPSTNATRIL
jgi:hypothetical protein